MKKLLTSLAVTFCALTAVAQVVSVQGPAARVPQYGRADFTVTLKGEWNNPWLQEEAALLEPFMSEAEKGQMLDTAELEKRYEEAVGHRIGSGQIYRVLQRHDWRKVMPRSKHPKKASEEVIETSKKLTMK